MKKFLFAFLIIFLSVGDLRAGPTGWFCGSCNLSNMAMSDGSTFCENNPCDESCYYCGDTVTNESLAITGGTRYWQNICPDLSSLIYCKNGIEAACDLGGMLS